MDIKFSIIVPIYKTEQFLEECVDSILNQSYENFEVILVNDGSPDGADKICREYEIKDSRVKYFYKQNEGVAIARNFGISKSVGDWVYCVDSDDTIEHNFLEKIAETIKSCKDYIPEVVVINERCSNINFEQMGALSTCEFCVSKKILEKYPDVRFQEHIMPCEDGLFSHKLLCLTDKIVLCKTAKYFYRINPNSSEHNIDPKKMLNDIPLWLKYLSEFYDKYSLWYKKRTILAFISKEPFARLNSKRIKFKYKDKEKLFNIIKNYIKENDLLGDVSFNGFTFRFKCFLHTTSFFQYSLLIMILNTVQNLFAIKNEYNNGQKTKVVTVMGVKIKINRENYKEKKQPILNNIFSVKDNPTRRSTIIRFLGI